MSEPDESGLQSDLRRNKFQHLRKGLEQRRLEMESNRTKVQQLQEQLAERERTIEQLQRSLTEPAPIAVSDEEEEVEHNINEDIDDDESYDIPNIEVNAIAAIQARAEMAEARVEELEEITLSLRESLKATDSVVEARTQAIALLTESLTAKRKQAVDELEETRKEMRIMQERFSEAEIIWQKEREALISKLKLISENVQKENPESSNALESLQNKIAELEEEKGHFQLQVVEHDEIKESEAKLKSQVEHFEKQITEKFEIISKLNKEHEELKLKNESLCSESSSFEQRAVVAEMKAVDLEEKLDSFEEAQKYIDNLLKENESLKDNIRERMSYIEHLLEKDFSRADISSLNVEENLPTKEETQLYLEHQLRERTKRFDQLVVHCRNLEQQINKNNQTSEIIVQLESKCKNLQQQLNEALDSSKIQQLNSLSSLENKCQLLQEQVFHAKQWETKCRELQEKLSEVHNQGKLKLEEKIIQVQVLEKNYKQLEIDYNQNIEILNDLQKNNEILNKEMNELKKIKGNLDTVCNDQLKSLKISEENYEKILAQCKDFEQQLTDYGSLKVSHNLLLTQIQDFQGKHKENVKIVRKAQEYKRRYNEAKSELETLTAKLKEYELVAEQRENDVTRLQHLLAKAEPAQEQLREVQQDLDQLRGLYETERSEKSSLQLRLIELEAHCQQQEQGLVSAHASWRQSREEMISEIDQIKTDLKESRLKEQKFQQNEEKLMNHLKKLEESLAQAHQDTETLLTKQEEDRNRREKLEQQLIVSEKRVGDALEEAQQWRNEATHKNERLQSREQELRELTNIEAQHINELTLLRQQMDSYSSTTEEIQRLRETLELSEIKNTELVQQITHLQYSEEEIKKQCKQINDQREEDKIQIQHLSKIIESGKEDQSQKLDLENSLTSLQNELKLSKDENQIQEQKIKNQIDVIKSLENELVHKQEEIDTIIQNSQAELKSIDLTKEQLLNSLKQEISEKDIRIIELSNNFQKLEQDYQYINNNLQQNVNELDNLTRDKLTLQQIFDETKNNLEQLKQSSQNEIEFLKTNRITQQSEFDNIYQSLIKSNTERNEFKNELIEKNSKLEQLQNEIEKLNLQVSNFEKEQQENTNHLENYYLLQNQIINLNEQYKMKQDSYDSLENEYIKAQANHEQLLQQFNNISQNFQQERDKYLQELNLKQKENEQINEQLVYTTNEYKTISNKLEAISNQESKEDFNLLKEQFLSIQEELTTVKEAMYKAQYQNKQADEEINNLRDQLSFAHEELEQTHEAVQRVNKAERIAEEAKQEVERTKSMLNKLQDVIKAKDHETKIREAAEYEVHRVVEVAQVKAAEEQRIKLEGRLQETQLRNANLIMQSRQLQQKQKQSISSNNSINPVMEARLQALLASKESELDELRRQLKETEARCARAEVSVPEDEVLVGQLEQALARINELEYILNHRTPEDSTTDMKHLELSKLHESSSQQIKQADTPMEVQKQKQQDELALAMYMLHQRDMRCEELTHELFQLLEERDALQLRLSTALKQNEELRSSNLSSLESSSNDVTLPPPPDTILADKLSELRAVGHRRDLKIQKEREERLKQSNEMLLQRTPQSSQSLTRDVQSTSEVIWNWMLGKSTPKILDV